MSSCHRCGGVRHLYYRRSSGEVLCRRCLERLLIRAIRRSLGRIGRVRYGDPILVAEPAVPGIWFASSVVLLYKSVRDHRNRLLVSIDSRSSYSKYYSRLWGDLASELEVVYTDRYVDIDAMISRCLSQDSQLDRYVCLKKIDTVAGVYVSTKINIDKVAVLRSRDQVPAIAVLGVLLRDPSTLIETRLYRDTSAGVHIINPIHDVSQEDLAAYSYLSGLTLDIGFEGSRARALEVFRAVSDALSGLNEIIYRSRETAFSADRAIDFIDSRLSSSAKNRCGLCGVKIDVGRDLCERCLFLAGSLKDLSNPL